MNKLLKSKRRSMSQLASSLSSNTPQPPPEPSQGPLTRAVPLSKLVVIPGPRRSVSEVNALLEAEVKELYSQLPYHGWDHVQAVRANMAVLIARCKRAGLKVDEIALDRAALCHDLLFCADPRALGFDSPELLASHMAYNLLRKHGASEREARKVERIINATHALVKPQKREEMLLRAADLFSLGENYEKFFSHTKKLHEEAQQIKKVSVPFDKFAFGSLEYLALYVWRFLELTPMARDARGASDWHKKSLENLRTLFLTSQTGHVNITRAVLGAENSIHRPHYGASANYFEVIVHPQESIRETLLHVWRKNPFKREGSSRKIRFVVPGSARSVPLPDETYDEVFLNSESYLKEAARVIKAEGVVRAAFSPRNFAADKGIQDKSVQRFLRKAAAEGLELLSAEEVEKGISLSFTKRAAKT